METKESKEKKLKELSDKELKNVSGGGNKGIGMKGFEGGLWDFCNDRGEIYNPDTHMCEKPGDEGGTF